MVLLCRSSRTKGGGRCVLLSRAWPCPMYVRRWDIVSLSPLRTLGVVVSFVGTCVGYANKSLDTVSFSQSILPYTL